MLINAIILGITHLDDIFETRATDWTNNGITVASINNFHEYEKEDGSGYETVLEVKKATSGEFEANTPYLLRTNYSGSKTITFNFTDEDCDPA